MSRFGGILAAVSLLCHVGLLFAAPDLTVLNSCTFGLWIEGRDGNGNAITGSAAVTYAPPGGSVTYTVPAAGLISTRFWPKYGCDSTGNNCLIGHQVPDPDDTNFPGPYDPPIDSLFEATWGCKTCPGDVTYWDTSQVDGYTIPYRVQIAGGDPTTCDGGSYQAVDATHLSLSDCPTDEDLSDYGAFPQYAHEDLRVIVNGIVVGCASPCKKMNFVQNLPDSQWPVPWYCCPTTVKDPDSDNCQVANGCFLPATCRAGPIPNTTFVKVVHQDSVGVYAYSYDDLNGNHNCPVAFTYTMEYCPPGASPYPISNTSSSVSSTTGSAPAGAPPGNSPSTTGSSSALAPGASSTGAGAADPGPGTGHTTTGSSPSLTPGVFFAIVVVLLAYIVA